ncbi:hypothetical protein NLJ89_g1579 [Agrocybe chaxingu]|uniref:3-hydroxyisobutyryl-CoA hydrolase n=1 Tax=Agrocybe chaxingu TaxID=84603 RepID=A0A9W8TE52_9AGAR|nr:hypothetical protein NLJ89_g1579 [Agrocybe chaxingu]
MFAATLRTSMPRTAALAAAQRTTAVAHHLMSTAAASPASEQEEATVLFESNGSLRTYILNRPKKLNALDEPMLSILRPKIEEWSASDLCGTIVGRGNGRAFCSGGDVASVVQNASDPTTIPHAIDYFKRDEHGLATHYIPSRRIPLLLDRLAELDKPHASVIDRTLEDLSAEREPTEAAPPFVGAKRAALDRAFRHNTVERIVTDLEAYGAQGEDAEVKQWASDTLALLHLRSPTSLKVSLEAIRRGKRQTLFEALEMELKIATAFCRGASPDFLTGVKAVLVSKSKEKPEWSPGSLKDVTPEIVSRFFDPQSPYLADAPKLDFPEEQRSAKLGNPLKYALPTEEEIASVVIGSHGAAGGNLGLRFEEVLARFAELRGGKLGVKEKVTEVVNRRCELTDNADGNFVWLKWKHLPK